MSSCRRQEFKILVIESNELHTHYILEVLNDGSSVTSVNTGKQALEHLSQNVPNKILLGTSLPDIDGIELCRQIRKNPRFSKTDIVVQSAKAMKTDIEKAYRAGANHYIVKPYDPELLLEIVLGTGAMGSLSQNI